MIDRNQTIKAEELSKKSCTEDSEPQEQAHPLFYQLKKTFDVIASEPKVAQVLLRATYSQYDLPMSITIELRDETGHITSTQIVTPRIGECVNPMTKVAKLIHHQINSDAIQWCITSNNTHDPSIVVWVRSQFRRFDK